MDRIAVGNALKAAIRAPGTAIHPPFPGVDPKSDQAIVTANTSVGIEPKVLAELVEALHADPDLGALHGRVMGTGFGGGMPFDLTNFAKFLLAQALQCEDVDKAITGISGVIDRNEADFIAVMTLTGTELDEPVSLCPDVMLQPISDLPPSIPRGLALGQAFGAFTAPPFQRLPQAALTARLTVGPIISDSSDATHAKKFKQQQDLYREKLDLLFEARNCLALTDLAAPSVHMIWWQPCDIFSGFLASPSWTVGTSDRFDLEIIPISSAKVKAVCEPYFRLPREDREKKLQIPIDRLARAIRQGSLADRAIDLGIALEALLMHDIDEGELTFKLRSRGAWLGGGTLDQRKAIFSQLNDLYKYRSKAVHRGHIPYDLTTAGNLQGGLQLCADLIKAVIDRKGKIDWNSLLLGGA